MTEATPPTWLMRSILIDSLSYLDLDQLLVCLRWPIIKPCCNSFVDSEVRFHMV